MMAPLLFSEMPDAALVKTEGLLTFDRERWNDILLVKETSVLEALTMKGLARLSLPSELQMTEIRKAETASIIEVFTEWTRG